MKFTILGVVLLVITAACFSDRSTGPRLDADACTVQLPTDAFGSTVVVIRDFAFTPASIRIRPGTKVTWVNCDTPGKEAHTSTAQGSGWGSPLLAPGETYTYEFAAAGAFPYRCAPHPGMQGHVTVE